MAMPKGIEGKLQVMTIVDMSMVLVAKDPESTERTALFAKKLIEFVSTEADGKLNNAEVVAAVNTALNWVSTPRENGLTASEIMDKP